MPDTESPSAKKARECREFAEAARRRATESSIIETREAFLKVAEQWEKLAKEIERLG